MKGVLNLKKVKKFFTTGLSLLILFSMLAGCGGGGNNSNNQTSDKDKGKEGENETITLMSDDVTRFGDKFDEYIKSAEEATGIKIDVNTVPTNTDDRLAKITTILASGDTSVDVITVSDEMLVSFKSANFLEPLQDTVMTDEVMEQLPEAFNEVLSKDKNIYGVPEFVEIYTFWVDQAKVDALGMDAIETKEDFVKFVEAYSKDGHYAYGGAWDKTYLYNELGTMINLFGGDFFDWNNEKTQEAVKFLHDMVQKDQISISQMADQYDTMMQKMFDGTYSSFFMYQSAMDRFLESGRYGPDEIHIAPVPKFETQSTYMASWSYVLNASSEKKEASKKFMKWAASPEGQKAYNEMTSRLPARMDVINDKDFETEGIDDIRDYFENTTLIQRPIVPQSMEFISSMGSLFQQYVSNELSLEEYVKKAQESVDQYAK